MIDSHKKRWESLMLKRRDMEVSWSIKAFLCKHIRFADFAAPQYPIVHLFCLSFPQILILGLY